MDEFETKVKKLVKQGWFTVFSSARSGGWTCATICGVDILQPNVTRPIVSGSTIAEALANAEGAIAEIMAQYKKA